MAFNKGNWYKFYEDKEASFVYKSHHTLYVAWRDVSQACSILHRKTYPYCIIEHQTMQFIEINFHVGNPVII